jgi:serine protease
MWFTVKPACFAVKELVLLELFEAHRARPRGTQPSHEIEVGRRAKDGFANAIASLCRDFRFPKKDSTFGAMKSGRPASRSSWVVFCLSCSATFACSARELEHDTVVASATLASSCDRASEELKAVNDNWTLRAIHAGAAWNLLRAKGRGHGEGVTVAHIDTGTSSHPELLASACGKSPVDLARGRNFVDPSKPPFHDFGAWLRIPGHGHGTETSSVLASPLGCPPGASSPCVSGIASDVTLLPLRISDTVILLDGSRAADAIDYAVGQGADVVAMAVGGVTFMPKLEAAVARALAAGVIVVAAAGNATGAIIVSPSSYDGVVCVGASGPTGAPWFGTNFGSRIDLSAPGKEVAYAKTTGDGKGKLTYEVALAQGTSDATAYTAGAAALWLAYHGVAPLRARDGSRLPIVFRTLLKTVAYSTPAGWPREGYGPGVLDVEKLLQAPLP